MSHIRPLPDHDLDAFVAIVARAYPGIELHTPAAREQFKERARQQSRDDPAIRLYGLYRDDRLLGGMRLFDFDLNLFGQTVPAGGVGLVATDLFHKKMHVARDLLRFFLRHYRERRTPLALLYPFRPDFYKQMGFGYGAKLNRYRFRPRDLPLGRRDHVRALGPADAAALLDCYTRVFGRTHGMIARTRPHFERVLASGENVVAGVEHDGHLAGYLIGMFKPARPGQFMPNDFVIDELLYESPAALGELLSFLHTQADQIETIHYATQDDGVSHWLRDPRDGSGGFANLSHDSNTQALGLMYRVIDVPGIFRVLESRDWGGQTCRLKVTISDSFLPENAGSTIVAFEAGRARVADDESFDVELRLDVAEFSSLLVGAVRFETLQRYGLATLSDDAWAPVARRIFASDVVPQCVTYF